LGRRRYAVLATARADGRAHASPVAFVVADGAFWFAIVRGVRLRNLHACPWASVVVMEGEADEREAGERHRAVTVEGPVRLYEGEAFASARGRLDSLWVERHGHPPDWALAIIELRPERVFSHAAPE
jgi:putative heme iron utilization protein